MNYSTAVFLINDQVRAVTVSYDPDDKRGGETVLKTLDQSIKVDDIVVVPSSTRHKMTTCRVTAVDVDIDLDSSTNVPWVIQRVDTAAFDKYVGQEADAIATIRKAEIRQKREAMKDAIFKDHEETLKALALTHSEPDQ